MKRLLITGARGFVGRHCLIPALEAGFKVHALGSSGGVPPELQYDGVTWHVGDLLADGTARSLIEQLRPTHVLHAAWITAHGSYWTSSENLRWLAAGTRLVEAFAATKGSRFVSVGTCAEYEWTQGEMLEGVTPERPATFYGAVKLAHASMIQAAARQFKFSAATGRIFFAYGPHENAERIIPYACRQLCEGKEAKFASGRFWRDFCHVTDVARGFIALLDSEIEGPCNVCSGSASQLADIVTSLGRMCGRENLIQLCALPDRPGDPPILVGDNQLLRSTGWKPKVSLEEGLRKTLDWWKQKQEC
jgi:nucleoside-diphosphate-sugar epimerase